MIRDALGASPLDKNIRSLLRILASRADDTSPSSATRNEKDGARATDWAVQAFRRAGADEVRVEKFGPSAALGNVVAEIRGREKPPNYVLFAASLDLSGSDSLANAENAAVLVDAVRVIHATGNIPRRSIRFVLFESGPQHQNHPILGSQAYALRHRADLDRIAAAVTLNAAGGPLDGFSLEDRPEMLAVVQAALAPLKPLGIRNFTEGITISKAVTPFWLEGVPTLAATSPGKNVASGDSPRGTPAQSSPDAARLGQLKRGVAVAAVAAYALADAPSRIGPRRPQSSVERSISSMVLEPKLKAAGLWTNWKASQSGTPH